MAVPDASPSRRLSRLMAVTVSRANRAAAAAPVEAEEPPVRFAVNETKEPSRSLLRADAGEGWNATGALRTMSETNAPGAGRNTVGAPRMMSEVGIRLVNAVVDAANFAIVVPSSKSAVIGCDTDFEVSA